MRLLLLPLIALPLLAEAQIPADGHLIHSIYFGGGSYQISQRQYAELNEFLQQVDDLPHTIITIHSHTDDIGTLEYNEWLSEMRSQMARQHLLRKGIPPENMSIQDFGELNPVYDNSTWEGKLKNRRVDIIIRRLEM